MPASTICWSPAGWDEVRNLEPVLQDAEVTTGHEKQDSGAALRDAVLGLLNERLPGRTICPSEVARRLGGKEWRELMELVRNAAWQLASIGQVVILQRGQRVERASLRGPIRIALPAARKADQKKVGQS